MSQYVIIVIMVIMVLYLVQGSLNCGKIGMHEYFGSFFSVIGSNCLFVVRSILFISCFSGEYVIHNMYIIYNLLFGYVCYL